MLTTCWDTGVLCTACDGEITLGEEILYGQHLSCARDAAQARRETAAVMTAVSCAQLQITAKGRIMLSRRQLRELIAMVIAANPAFAPVRRPDKGAGPMQWYGRISGWDPARVAAGLSPPEVAGLWLDYLDVGRTPPVKHRDLSEILALIPG